MSIDDVVSISISTETVSLSRAGFGTPLVAAADVPFVGARVRTYGSTVEMVADGFLISDAAVLAGLKFESQNPKVPEWKVGRLDNKWGQAVDLTVGVGGDAENLVHTIEVEAHDGSVTQVSYTVLLADTIADVVTALTALLDAITDLSAGAASPDVNLTADLNAQLFAFRGLNKELSIKTVTTDAGIAADLAAIVAEDDDWYGLILDHKSELISNPAAAFHETNKKLMVIAHSDTEITDGAVSDDIFSDLKASAFARTAGIFHEDDRAFADAGWMGKQFPKTPGSSTWVYQTIAGLKASVLTTAQQNAIDDKNGNYSHTLKGVNVTRKQGIVFAREFIDVVRFTDELGVRIQEDVFAALVNNEKIGFTDAGVTIITGVVDARLDQGIIQGGLADTPAPTVTAPLVANVPVADRAARRLPDIAFTGTLEGAIHTADIAGVLSV